MKWKNRQRQLEHLRELGRAKEGGHGGGETKRGIPDHATAKAWIIQDPGGEIFTFSNLAQWLRENLFRFEDENPGSRISHDRRLAPRFSERKPGEMTAKGWRIINRKQRTTKGTE